MRRNVVCAVIALLVLSLAGCKSREEKAQELIRQNMFKTLYDFESYEPIEIAIDSAFTSIYTDADALRYGRLLLDILNEMDGYKEAVSSAFSSMDIWSDSYTSYGRRKYYAALIEAEDNQKKLTEGLKLTTAYQDSIRKINSILKPEFIGWKVAHKFRCKNKGGNFSIGDYIYYIDPDMKEILRKEDVDDEDYIKLMAMINITLQNDSVETTATE